MSGTAVNWRDHGVRVLRRDAIDRGEAQGLVAQRIATLTHAPPGVDTLAARSLALAPGISEPSHHHAAMETIICIVSGTALIRWGESLEYFCTAGPGDLLFVAAWVPHQEQNASATEALHCVLLAEAGELPTVPLDISAAAQAEEIRAT